MIYIVMNLTAIILATLAGLAFGIIYYRIAQRGRSAPSRIRGALFTAFVSEFWVCAILAGALILAPPKGSLWMMTLGSAFVIWVGFVVPTLVSSYRYRGIAMRAALVDCCHWLGMMVVQAGVLRLIGLVPPPN